MNAHRQKTKNLVESLKTLIDKNYSMFDPGLEPFDRLLITEEIENILDVDESGGLNPEDFQLLYETLELTYQNVSQTDWEIDSFLKRKYWDKNIIDIFESCTDILKKEMYGPLSKKFKVIVDNYWFHIYKKNSDYQWHTHGHSNFSAIYYISLPEKKYKTKFLNMDIPVKEGDLLIFPSFLAHCSPINKSNKEKVVLSFNFSII